MALEIKKGDILLYPNNKNNPLYKYVSGIFGETITKLLMKASDYRYVHTAIYLCPSRHKGYFWSLEALDKGVYLIEKPISHLQFVDVVHNKGMTSEKADQLVDLALNKYWNQPYDFASLLLNGICKIAEIFQLKEYLENLFSKYIDTPHEVICSELVGRLLEDIGLPIEHEGSEDFITPEDIADSNSFIMVLKN
ncbi:hypothetical protein [Oceanotoga phage vB_OteS-UFV02]